MERSTRQRDAIHAALHAAGRPLSPQEILEVAQANVPAIGIATVYRTLKTLIAEHRVQAVNLPGQAARYELEGGAHGHHHHHFQCTHCQRVFDIDACPGRLDSLAPAGYVVESHDLTLYGRCAACA